MNTISAAAFGLDMGSLRKWEANDNDSGAPSARRGPTMRNHRRLGVPCKPGLGAAATPPGMQHADGAASDASILD